MKYLFFILITIVTYNASALGLFDDYKSNSQRSEQFLPPDQAFNFSYEIKEDVVKLQWLIPENYYMYKDRLKITYEGNVITHKQKNDAVSKYDENFDAEMEVYYQIMEVELKKGSLKNINVEYQGCAEAGLCYSPQKKNVNIDNQS